MNFDNLEEKLNSLTAADFESAEKAERNAGNNYADVAFTKSFQLRLAAIALGINYNELRTLPITKAYNVTSRVFAFLVLGSTSEEAPSNNSEV